VPENTKRILGIHAGLAVAQVVCVSAFSLEISRALSGNTLSWAYVVEWPIFSAYAIYLWRRLLKDERAALVARDDAPNETNEPDDPALAAYNAYLRDVHQTSPPSRRAN